MEDYYDFWKWFNRETSVKTLNKYYGYDDFIEFDWKKSGMYQRWEVSRELDITKKTIALKFKPLLESVADLMKKFC